MGEHCELTAPPRTDANARASLGSRLARSAPGQVKDRQGWSFLAGRFGFGPLSARRAGFHSVANLSRGLVQEEVLEARFSEEARNPSEKRLVATAPHSPGAV
jgi:hypothetical protein